MDNTKNIVIGVLATLTIVFGILLFSKPSPTLPPPLGLGTDHYYQESFLAGLVEGGGIRATSTVNNAETLLASDFDVENVIDYTLNVQAATLTLPASTTLTSFLPKSGDTRTILIRNATTTATNLTIAGATGVLLKKATTTAIIYGDTDGANYGTIKFTRKANRDIEAIFDSFVD